MRQPTKTSGAAVAQRGTCWKSGVKKVENKKRMPVTTEARPVRAPSFTPAAHSKKTMQGLQPSAALSMVLRPTHAYTSWPVLPGSSSSSSTPGGARSKSRRELSIESAASRASRFTRGRSTARAMPNCTPPTSKTVMRSIATSSCQYLTPPLLSHSSMRSWLKVKARLGILKGSTALPPPISKIHVNAVVRTMAMRMDPLTFRRKSALMTMRQNAKSTCAQPLAASPRLAKEKSRPPTPMPSNCSRSVSLERNTCMILSPMKAW
mmetsp:Transcript_47699/g.103764  ORF Transcript_47699/g.103764 Transcript_47699/m.103764 type:complete len:264 (+) Transcript_47699:537-1328(+)